MKHHDFFASVSQSVSLPTSNSASQGRCLYHPPTQVKTKTFLYGPSIAPHCMLKVERSNVKWRTQKCRNLFWS